MTLSDIQQEIGGLAGQCFASGGATGLFATGVNGSYLLQLVAPGASSYEARVPVVYADAQSDGGSVHTIAVGGVLVIRADFATCENGIVTQIAGISASIGIYDTYWSDTGEPTGLRGNWRVYAANISDPPILPGVSYPNLSQTGCGAQGDGTHFGGTARFNQPADCILPPIWWIAQKCGGAETISFDPASLPEPTGIVRGLEYQQEVYIPTGQATTEPPVPVNLSEEGCDTAQPTLYAIARLCNSIGQSISYDPKLAPPGARTCVFNTRRYQLTTTTTEEPPEDVVFSTRTCSNLGFGNCNDLTGPDDPRCQECTTYAHCAICGCNGPNIGPPFPRPESPELPDPPELPGIFNWGTITKRAIALLTMHKVKHCGRCERRALILDAFGQKIGSILVRRFRL